VVSRDYEEKLNFRSLTSEFAEVRLLKFSFSSFLCYKRQRVERRPFIVNSSSRKLIEPIDDTGSGLDACPEFDELDDLGVRILSASLIGPGRMLRVNNIVAEQLGWKSRDHEDPTK